MNKSIKIIILIAGIIIISLIIWGLIGAHTAQDPGISCDMGVKNLCWKWHTNTLGQINEVIGDLFKK